jgi:hypothetical protein
MAKITVSIVSSEPLIAAIRDLADTNGIRRSEPVRTDPSVTSLRGPFGVGPEEAKQILELIKLVFEGGAAAIIFVEQLRSLLKKLGGAVEIQDAKSGTDSLVLRGDTKKKDAEAWIKRRK